MSKRILSLVLALVMVLGTFSFAFAAEPVDGPTDNGKVNWLIQEGLVEGDEQGYRLEDPIKRSEVAAMVVRARGQEDLADSLASVEKFPDVLTSPADKWANGYINVAAADGIVTGYEDGTFRPANNITKAEAVAMMVRVAGGLSEEEEKLAVGKNWAAPYLIKAHELGILEGVELGNANEAATREFVFELVYNTLQISETGRYNILKGIVLENYRVESLDKDEIVIEVIREVQRAKYAEKSRAEEGDQIKLVVPAKVADVENLLGKVADFTINEKDEVVRVKIDDSYEYVQGAIEATRDRLTVAGKRYTVELDERYADKDERIFRSYFNNENFAYRDFYRDEDAANAEFARVTVKNGKVLFIDAFSFDDIAPVADVTEKGAVLYYDDYKDGEVDELDEADYVLVYENGELGFGKYEDIDVNDVLHWFVNNKELTVVVRPEADNLVEGEYEEAYAAKAKEKDTIYIVVDDEDYRAKIVKNRTPVYSYTMEIEDFFALDKYEYDLELKDFEGKDVIVLRDMFGNVQLIGADLSEDSFYAVVTNTSRRDAELKLLRTDGEQVWYETDRDTTFRFIDVDGKYYTPPNANTQDKKFDKFAAKDFVKVMAEDDLVTEITQIKYETANVEKINKDVIDIEGDDYYYMSKNAILFVNYSKVMDIATFLKDYKAEGLKAAVVVTSDRDEDVARIIIIENAELKVESDKKIVKVRDVRFTGGKYRLDVTYGDGTTGRHEVASDATGIDIRDVERGDFLILTVTKDDDEIVTDIKAVDWTVAPAKAREVDKYDRRTDRREGFIEFKKGDPRKVLISRDAHVFGEPAEGKYVAYRYKKNDEGQFVVDIVAVVAKPEEDKGPETVTYSVEDYNAVHGRFTVEDREGNVKTLFVDEFDGWRIGDDDVSLAVMLAWLADKDSDGKTNGSKLEKVDVVTEDGKEILVVEGTLEGAALDVYAAEWAEALAEELGMDVKEVKNGFVAAFDAGIEVPEVLEGYFYIDVLITLADGVDLDDVGDVTVQWNNADPVTLDKSKVVGGKIWVSDIMLGGNPAKLTTGEAATWTVAVEAADEAEEEVVISGTIESFISTNFNDSKVEMIKLAEGKFEFTVEVVEGE